MTISRIATRYWGQLWRQGMRSMNWLNQQTHGWLGMLTGAAEQAIKPESVITAAAIACFTLFALFPFTFLSIAIASFSLGPLVGQHLWERIVELAQAHGGRLPSTPDAKALEEFLVMAKAAAPLRFPDLSLAVIKLLGSGEYVAELPGENIPGHFGLAVQDYAHSTAPNRRYPDLITQRLLKAAIDGKAAPYRKDELDVLATHCTEAEDAATKVERQVGKAALLLEARIGEQFDALVTGALAKGARARLLTVPVEGKIVHGFERLDVGDRVRVQLIGTNVERGFIDFKHVGSSRP